MSILTSDTPDCDNSLVIFHFVFVFWSMVGSFDGYLETGCNVRVN